MEIQMWKEILNPYELAVEELQVKFNHMVKEYRQAGIYSPIEQVLGRVKYNIKYTWSRHRSKG